MKLLFTSVTVITAYVALTIVMLGDAEPPSAAEPKPATRTTHVLYTCEEPDDDAHPPLELVGVEPEVAAEDLHRKGIVSCIWKRR